MNQLKLVAVFLFLIFTVSAFAAPKMKADIGGPITLPIKVPPPDVLKNQHYKTYTVVGDAADSLEKAYISWGTKCQEWIKKTQADLENSKFRQTMVMCGQSKCNPMSNSKLTQCSSEGFYLYADIPTFEKPKKVKKTGSQKMKQKAEAI